MRTLWSRSTERTNEVESFIQRKDKRKDNLKPTLQPNPLRKTHPRTHHSTQTTSGREWTFADVGDRNRNRIPGSTVLGRILLRASLLVAAATRLCITARLAWDVLVDVAVRIVIHIWVRADCATVTTISVKLLLNVERGEHTLSQIAR